MNLNEVLKMANHVVSNKTGRNLSKLQETILRGTWEDKDYKQIAKEVNLSERRTREVGSQLWKILTEELQEDINKWNFKGKMERLQIAFFSNVVQDHVKVGTINFCGENKYPPNIPNSHRQAQEVSHPQKHQDLTDRPHINTSIHRPSELSTLTQWLLQDHSNLITLYGLSGIGKTALAIQLIEQIQEHFDYIIWRNLSQFPTYELLENNLIQYFNQHQETQSSSLINYLKNHPTLLILDKLETIITPRELTNHYLPNAENYTTFFEEITTAKHPSSLLLISWEKPQQIATLEKKNPTYCRTLPIKGLDATAAETILINAELTGQEKWLELINLYSGHPFWLDITTTTIQELFDGDVNTFLAEGDLYLGDIEGIVRSHYQRLSSAEKSVITWLANQDQPVTLTRKPLTLNCSQAEFLKAVQNLIRRCLIEKIMDTKPTLFTLLPVIKQYIKNHTNEPAKN